MKTIKVNTIYPAFAGEVNAHGIGVPCVFVRLAGCNLRCYFKTKGILCDTPEALEMKNGKDMLSLDRPNHMGVKVGESVGKNRYIGDINIRIITSFYDLFIIIYLRNIRHCNHLT